MTYEHLRGVFTRTGTIPITGKYGSQYPRVCLNAALTIEKQQLTPEQVDNYSETLRSDEFSSYEGGWEGDCWGYYANKEQYDMAVRLRKELKPEKI